MNSKIIYPSMDHAVFIIFLQKIWSKSISCVIWFICYWFGVLHQFTVSFIISTDKHKHSFVNHVSFFHFQSVFVHSNSSHLFGTFMLFTLTCKNLHLPRHQNWFQSKTKELALYFIFYLVSCNIYFCNNTSFLFEDKTDEKGTTLKVVTERCFSNIFVPIFYQYKDN